MPFSISWPVVVAMAVFIGVSVVVGSAMGGAGGWRSLARRYPARSGAAPEEERYRFSSMRTSGGLVGTAAYASCVTFGVGPRGISVELWAPFRLFHPPFHLPWEAVASCRVVAFVGGSLTHLEIRGGGTLTVGGRPGAAIARAAATAGVGDGRHSADARDAARMQEPW